MERGCGRRGTNGGGECVRMEEKEEKERESVGHFDRPSVKNLVREQSQWNVEVCCVEVSFA